MQARCVLLIAFKYPPYRRVGAKRWAKITKYWAKLGIDVHVLTVHWGKATTAELADVTDPRITIHRIPSCGPHRLSTRSFTSDLVGRVLDPIRVRLLRVVRGTSFGRDARWWGLTMLPAASRLIRRHEIDTVVVTSGPPMANYWASRLKKRHPEILLVHDFRDPWSARPAGAVVHPTSKFHRREAETLQGADAVVGVTEAILDDLSALQDHPPLLLIRNGVDPEDFRSDPAATPRGFTILYAGSVYGAREAPVSALLRAVRDRGWTADDVRLRFFGGFSGRLAREYQGLVDSSVLEVLPAVPATQIATEIMGSFACLHVNGDVHPTPVSTKIYEYAYARRPVLSVNYGGEVDGLVLRHRLGWSVRADAPEAVDRALAELRSHWEDDPDYEPESVSIEGFEYPRIAQQYADTLDRLRASR